MIIHKIWNHSAIFAAVPVTTLLLMTGCSGHPQQDVVSKNSKTTPDETVNKPKISPGTDRL